MNNTSSHYETLTKAFIEKQTADRTYMDESQRLVGLISEGFRKYAAFPESYKHHDGSERRYIPCFGLDPKGQFHPVDDHRKAINYFPNQAIEFGMGVVLEEAPDQYPKAVVRFRVGCQRQDGQVQADIGGTRVDFAFDGQDSPDIEKAYLKILDLLQEFINRRIGQFVELEEDEQYQVGFDLDSD
ncbi:MAG: hypothetical protein AAFQ66_12765 [Pseudomonadota bacterium]